MNLWKSAAETVQTALKAKRIGTPVFARIVAHTVEDHGRIEPVLATALEASAAWMGESIIRVAALGSVASGQITLLASFARGQTALISAGTRATSPALIEMTVIGNRGTITWEPATCEALAAKEPDPDLTGDARRLLRAVRQSLELR